MTATATALELEQETAEREFRIDRVIRERDPIYAEIVRHRPALIGGTTLVGKCYTPASELRRELEVPA